MYNTYEEYMRNVLGYNLNNMQDMYTNNDYYIMQNNVRINNCNEEDLYPFSGKPKQTFEGKKFQF